jgi:hypothetical protein
MQMRHERSGNTLQASALANEACLRQPTPSAHTRKETQARAENLELERGLQYIDHPGYNQDRGPVLVEMLRVHVDF